MSYSVIKPASIRTLVAAEGGQAFQQRAGERRRRASSLQLASPPVATRNGLACLLLESAILTHRLCYRPSYISPSEKDHARSCWPPQAHGPGSIAYRVPTCPWQPLPPPAVVRLSNSPKRHPGFPAGDLRPRTAPWSAPRPPRPQGSGSSAHAPSLFHPRTGAASPSGTSAPALASRPVA